MKLALSALLVVSSLLTPRAHAASEGLTLDLPYIVRNGETLIGVATAPGRLRFYNQGPSAARLRWFDPQGGEMEQRILGPGQVLLSYGSLGVPVSPGTIVLLEQLEPGPFSIGFASLPTSASVFGYHPSHTPDNLFGDNSPKGSPSGCPASIWTAGGTTSLWTGDVVIGMSGSGDAQFFSNITLSIFHGENLEGGTLNNIWTAGGTTGIASDSPIEGIWTAGGTTSLNFGPFINVPTFAAAGFASQPGANDDIETGGTRFSGNVVEVGDSLWAAHTVIWTTGPVSSIWTDGTMTSIAPDGYVYLLLAGNHQNSPSVAIPPIGTYLAPNASPFLDGHAKELP